MKLSANPRTVYAAFFRFVFLAFGLLMGLKAQETAPNNSANSRAVARNSWESLYYRTTSSASSLLDILQTMHAEKDQAALASSYALMLKDQIRSYIFNRAEDPIYTQQILVFLLDKVAELASTLAGEQPELASTIGLSLLPELDYNIVMGKANYVLGRLGASNFGEEILKRLEKINYIMATSGHNVVGSHNHLGLSYAALGSMDALMQLQVPGTFSLLFQIHYGPFPQNVRTQAAKFIKRLQERDALAVEQEFIEFTAGTSSLSDLESISHNIRNSELMFSIDSQNKINLALLNRINHSVWPSLLGQTNIKATILLKSMKELLASGASGMQEPVSEQLIQSFVKTDSVNVKLLALEVLGTLAAQNSIPFLQQEILRINVLQRSAAINYTEERILRQLVYALGISGDSSPETRLALQEVAITPYPAVIRRFAEATLAKIS